MRNSSNRAIYRLWSPVYDLVFRDVYAGGRRLAVELLELQPGERLLVVGVGTGLELDRVPAGVDVVGVDLSPAMLARAAAKPRTPRPRLLVMDAQVLSFPDATFDAVLCSLILSVVPDGRAALEEAWRVLRPGGRLAIFDKFLAPDVPLNVPRRVLGWAASMIGTDVNRRLEEMLDGLPELDVVVDRPVLLAGRYRAILLAKAAVGSPTAATPSADGLMPLAGSAGRQRWPPRGT